MASVPSMPISLSEFGGRKRKSLGTTGKAMSPPQSWLGKKPLSSGEANRATLTYSKVDALLSLQGSAGQIEEAIKKFSWVCMKEGIKSKG